MTDFELEDTDGRRRRLSEFRGRPVVLAVAGQDAGEAVARFGTTVVPRLTDTDAVIVSVADATKVPRLVRGVARGAIRSGLQRAHKEAAREAPELPADAWDRFTMLLDWDGAALDALGLRGQTDRYRVLVLDGQGRERGRVVQGEKPLEEQVAAVVGWVKEA